MKKFLSPKDGPFLEGIASFFSQPENRRFNHRAVHVIVPNSRAKDLLGDLFKTAGVDCRVHDLSTFTDWLYQPHEKLADPFTELLTWGKVLQQMESGHPIRRELFGDKPPKFRGRLDLAERIALLRGELADEGHSFDSVARLPNLTPQEKARWEALSRLEEDYLRALADTSLADRAEERRRILAGVRPTGNATLFLAGILYLPAIHKKRLDQFVQARPDSVNCFLFAERSQEDRFDSYGTIIPERWTDLVFEIPEGQIFQLPTVVEEGETCARCLETLDLDQTAIVMVSRESYPFLVSESRKLGLSFPPAPEENLTANRLIRLLLDTARFLEQRRYDCFADLIRHPDLDEWFLREIPEIASRDWISALDQLHEKYLPDQIKTGLGTYSADNPGDEEDDRRKNLRENREALFRLCDLLDTLLAPFYRDKDPAEPHSGGGIFPAERRPAEWGDIIRAMVGTVYPAAADLLAEPADDTADIPAAETVPGSEGTEPIPTAEEETAKEETEDTTLSPAEKQIKTGISALKTFLDKLGKLPTILDKPITAVEFFALLQKYCAGRHEPVPAEEFPVPILTWNDARFETRPHLILTGMTDDHLPQNPGAGLFLSETLRRELRLMTANDQAVCDAAGFEMILRSHKSVTILFPGEAIDGSPAKPCRFLLMTEQVADSAKRILRFFSKTEDPAAGGEVFPFDPAEEGFRPPVLTFAGDPPSHFSPSSFKTFFESPYIWFLQQGLRLEALSDSAVEWGPDKFGSVVHDMLRRFGEDTAVRESTDERQIAAFLDNCLDQKLRRDQAGFASRITRLQLEQARERLHDFARWQARWRERGNRIVEVETSVPHHDPCLLTVDGVDVKISGQIDRIDYSPQTGELFIFDYKTFNSGTEGNGPSGDDPLLNRREKNEIDKRYWKELPYPPYRIGTFSPTPLDNGKWRHWIDLQLVLYRPLAKKILARMNFGQPINKITSGYIILPKTRLCKAFAADWTQDNLQEAFRTFEWVVRTIRAHWRTGVDPSSLIDPSVPERGTMLDHKAGRFYSDFAPITGLY
ncbi:MAG: PD-(D/E)XK nuclease family protein [Thermoguttaceae bacterium]|nr:PD-(D/E)XK nuclease family protein [Thermoguttaceae bacterium]